MRVDWCVSSWFRIKNTHSLTQPTPNNPTQPSHKPTQSTILKLGLGALEGRTDFYSVQIRRGEPSFRCHIIHFQRYVPRLAATRVALGKATTAQAGPHFLFGRDSADESGFFFHLSRRRAKKSTRLADLRRKTAASCLRKSAAESVCRPPPPPSSLKRRSRWREARMPCRPARRRRRCLSC